MRRSPMTRISEMTLLFCANAGAMVQKSTARVPNPLSVSLRRISGRMFLSCWIWELMLRRMTGKIGTPSLQPKSNFRSFVLESRFYSNRGSGDQHGARIGHRTARKYTHLVLAFELCMDRKAAVGGAPTYIQ